MSTIRNRIQTAASLAVVFSAAFAMEFRAQARDGTSLVTITNPTPAADDIFGGSVAGFGSDRVLVGAEGAAEAYLFSLDGGLLTTFTIPDPAAGSFGASLGAVGKDRALIGAYNYIGGAPAAQLGRAYLFTTNGLLITTFTNPAPATIQAFGWAVAALGSDRVLISGLQDLNKPGPYFGGVYLLRTNGAVLTSFTNPIPASDGGFGTALATVGSDRVLIGAPDSNAGAAQAGSAYLFNTNGMLLTTFTNPTPVPDDNFGTAVAAVGSDRLLISAVDYGASKGNGGAAYLYDTNGLLIITFTNPTPANYDYFGWSAAAVGNSRVLIGAYQDGTGDFQAGSAYLFSTNGTLLHTFTNPTPAHQDWFAWSVAAVGSDRVIVGGVWDDTGATHAGSAYLYTLKLPSLGISRSAGAVSVSWVTPETGLILQQTDWLSPSMAWSDATNSISVNGHTNVVQQPLADGVRNRFFRLRRF